MTLSHWSAFVEVCRTGSIRAAADAAGFSQPGLSRQVAALERTVGVELLERGPRGARPTPAGLALLPYARLVVQEARRGVDAARTATSGPPPLLVGVVPSASAVLLPRALRLLRDTGGPACSVVGGLTPRLTAMLVDREIDAAVVTDAPPGLPVDDALRADHLLDDPMVVIVGQQHRQAGVDAGEVDLAALAEETWIEDNDGSEAILRGLASRAGFDPRVVRSADDLATKAGMVAAGLGVALVPGLLVGSLRPDLVVLRPSKSARRGVHLLTRRTRHDDPALDQLRAALARAAS